MPNVTQVQIARLANVDRTTVSKIINGYQLDQFSLPVIEKVKTAALELGYKLNKRKDSLNIGLIFPLPVGALKVYSNSFRILEAIMGISNALRGTCHSFHVVNYSDDIKPALGQADAYLVWEVPSNNLLKKMDDSGIKYIVLNRITSDYAGSYVIHNDIRAFEMSAEHLISANHKNIAFVADRPPKEINNYLLAISAVLQKHGFNFTDSNFFFLSEENNNNQNILKYLEKNKITGIISNNDVVGYRVIDIISSSGKKIPQDYSIIINNFIDTCYFNFLKPTGIKTPWYEVAMQGAEILISKLKKKSNYKWMIHEIIEPKIIVGNTVKTL